MRDLFDRDRDIIKPYGAYARPGIARMDATPLTLPAAVRQKAVAKAQQATQRHHAARRALKILGW